MGDTEATLHPIPTVLSLDCHQVREVLPNCSGRVVRSAGRARAAFSYRPVVHSLCPTHNENHTEFQYWYTCTVCTCSKVHSEQYWIPVHLNACGLWVPTRDSSSIFRPYPAQPYINRKRSVWALQRCMVRLQQSSFSVDLPRISATVNCIA